MSHFRMQLIIGFFAGIILGFIAKGIVGGTAVALAITGIPALPLLFVAIFGRSQALPAICAMYGAMTASVFAGILLSTGEVGKFLTWLAPFIS